MVRKWKEGERERERGRGEQGHTVRDEIARQVGSKEKRKQCARVK